jgi:hypothetical protein
MSSVTSTPRNFTPNTPHAAFSLGAAALTLASIFVTGAAFMASANREAAAPLVASTTVYEAGGRVVVTARSLDRDTAVANLRSKARQG